MRIIAKKEERIDKYLQQHTEYSRAMIQKMIEDGNITVNDTNIKKNYLLKINDVIDYEILEKEQVKAENIQLDIVYEDEWLIIVNKDREMIVHPTETIKSKTLVNALMYRFKTLYNDDSERRGIVHRLDKDTTGLMIAVKDQECGERLKEMIKNRKLKKKYLAIVHGEMREDITVEKPICRSEKNRKIMTVSDDGKYAKTIFHPICSNKNFTLVEATIITGRTHQIRVHAKELKHPLLGDPLYGYKKERVVSPFPLLHSYYLQFIHPMTNQFMEFKKRPDAYFLERIDKCNLVFDKNKEDILSNLE